MSNVKRRTKRGRYEWKKKSFEFDQPRAIRECYAEIGSSGNFLFFVTVRYAIILILGKRDFFFFDSLEFGSGEYI